MEFKGTEGEWNTVESNRVIYVESKDNVLIAELDNQKTLGFEQATPNAVYYNAKLIAAAPDLLEALQDCLGSLELYVKDGFIMGGTISENKARKAIKKALGE